MPKYRINVCRIAYGNRDIEVTARNLEAATKKAEDTAGNYLFNEHTSKYEAQGGILIRKERQIKRSAWGNMRKEIISHA